MKTGERPILASAPTKMNRTKMAQLKMAQLKMWEKQLQMQWMKLQQERAAMEVEFTQRWAEIKQCEVALGHREGGSGSSAGVASFIAMKDPTGKLPLHSVLASTILQTIIITALLVI